MCAPAQGDTIRHDARTKTQAMVLLSSLLSNH